MSGEGDGGWLTQALIGHAVGKIHEDLLMSEVPVGLPEVFDAFDWSILTQHNTLSSYRRMELLRKEGLLYLVCKNTNESHNRYSINVNWRLRLVDYWLRKGTR